MNDRINYIEQINSFWAFIEDKDLSSSDIAVYFALLKYNNSLNWIKSFRCDWGIICQYANVSKNTFYKSIETLKEMNLIQHEKGQRNKLKPRIVILKLKNNRGTIREQNGNNDDLEMEQKGNLYKLLNNETIKLINNKTEREIGQFLNTVFKNFLKEQIEDNLIFPFDSENFKKQWQVWRDFKKEQFKFIYKPIGEQAALKEIGRISKNNEQTAIAIIHQSINNGWKGFFELKNNNNGTKQGLSSSEIAMDYAKRKAAERNAKRNATSYE